jgi:hypothetical protein
MNSTVPFALLECFLCQQILTDPITIPCGDTACRSCLIAHTYHSTFGVEAAADPTLPGFSCPNHPTVCIPPEADWKVALFCECHV